MYYAFVENDKLNGCGQCKILNEEVQNVVITKEVFNNIEKYVWNGESIVLNPDYDEEQAQKERERIGRLQVTKRVFALALQQLGITYTQLKELIATSEQAQLEWDLCVELQRNNPLLDIMAAQMGITSEQLDYIFRKANGEDVTLVE